MRIDDLARAVRELDPRACLVDPRVLRRVLRKHRGARGGLELSHDRCYWLDGVTLATLTAPRERASLDGELPGEVILLARPARDEGMRALRRALFHARVHLALEAKRQGGALGAAEVRARVHAIGQTTFDEIRAVLRQDGHLLHGADDVETFVEFAATYLELAHFERAALPDVFPTLDLDRVDRLLSIDVDAGALLARLNEDDEAPSSLSLPPPPPTSRRSRPSAPAIHDVDRLRGNHVRAAVFAQDERETRVDLESLVDRLGLDEEPHARKLAAALLPLVRAARGSRTPMLTIEARLLWDLQRAAIDRERPASEVRLLDPLLSFGARSWLRPLPTLALVGPVKKLRRALRKIPKTRLAREERARLREAIEHAVARADERMRTALRPKLLAVLAEVGLRPWGASEEVARDKLVEELLDRLSSRGFFGLGELRDAISRNRLKCGDLDAKKLLGGDELLRADAALARELAGVYRRGEIYLRGLQRASSLAFGTAIGRVLVSWVLLPLLAAFVILEGVQHVVAPLARATVHRHVHLLNRWSFGVLALFVLGVVQDERVRALSISAGKGLGRALHAVFVAAPVWLFTRPVVLAIARSGPVRFVARHVLKPAVVAVPAFVIARRAFGSTDAGVLAALGVLVVASFAMGSRAFAAVEEVLGDAATRALANVRTRVLPGVLSALLDAFRALVEGLERTIHWVDERLLFRRGDRRAALVAKGVFALLFGVVAFFVRIYVNLLIEPQVNPIKHFPVVTVSHKIVLPMLPALLEALRTPLLPLGPVVASAIAGTTVFLLPGVFGFLVWELKENFRLYRASLPRWLEPVRIGAHGETMTALLVPGFHSGTVPKLWTKMRRAARRIARREAFFRLAVRAHTRGATEIHEVEEAVLRFVDRELVALLTRSRRWSSGALRVSSVRMGSNRVLVELALVGGGPPCVIAFEEQSGLVVAHVARAGFLDALARAQRAVLSDALSGLYRLAAVDLVREEIEPLVFGAPYDVCDEGLAVWPDPAFRTELIYPLDRKRPVRPIVRGEPIGDPPALDLSRLSLRSRPIASADWARAWADPERGAIAEGSTILPRARGASS